MESASLLNPLLYGLDSLTLTPKQLHRIDGQYIWFLRRAIAITAVYSSHVSNQEVWNQAQQPILPSQTPSHRQYQLYIHVIKQPREESTHNVVFGPAFKDRILLKGRRRGMQFPYWVEVYSTKFLPHIKPDHTANPHSRYLKIAKLVRSPSFELAPKRVYRAHMAIAKKI